jgi:hypothetical protein
MSIQYGFALPVFEGAAAGSSWRQQRAAEILQRHRQCGMHRKVDVEALLARSFQTVETGMTSVYYQRLWASALASVEHSHADSRAPLIDAHASDALHLDRHRTSEWRRSDQGLRTTAPFGATQPARYKPLAQATWGGGFVATPAPFGPTQPARLTPLAHAAAVATDGSSSTPWR